MVDRLFFASTIIGADEYIKIRKTTGASIDVIVSMNPRVRSYLKRRGFDSYDTLPYFNNRAHQELLEKSNEIISWLYKNSYFVDLDSKAQDSLRSSFIFWVRFSIHHCLWLIEVVCNAVEIYKPRTLCTSETERYSPQTLYIEYEEEYFNLIVKNIASQRNLKYENLNNKRSVNTFYQLKIINDMRLLFKFIMEYAHISRWEKDVAPKNKKFMENVPILFTTRGYQMDKLAESLKRKAEERPFVFLANPIDVFIDIPGFIMKLISKKGFRYVQKQKILLNNLIEKIDLESAIFSHRGISFNTIISSKIKKVFSCYLSGLILWAVKLEGIINNIKPSVVVSNGNRDDDMITVKLCDKKNIPTLLISHGSHVRPKDKNEKIEWGEHGKKLLSAPFSYLVLQSPLSEGYLEVFPTTSKTIKTGPLIWGKPVDNQQSRLLFKKIFGEKYRYGDIKIVLHAGTPKDSNSLRFYVYETPDEYIKALCDLARAVETIPDAILIIKSRPSKEIGIDDLKLLVPFSEKVILSVDEAFSEVLGMADLFVSFSSTTIEEALQNRIPVLLYGGNGRYQHVSSYEVKQGSPVAPSAAYHVKEKEDLEYAIKGILNMNVKDEKNKDLFNSYIYRKESREQIAGVLKT